MWLKMIKCLVSLVILVLVCTDVSTNGGGLCQGFDSTDSDCRDGWTYIYRGCYSFKMEPAKSWEDAQNYCELENSSLASLTTNAELNTINATIRAYNLSGIDHLYWWVGLKFVSTTSGMSWMWTNGDTYGNVPGWEANSGLGAVGKCGLIHITGKVRSDNCDLERPYICKYEQVIGCAAAVDGRNPNISWQAADPGVIMRQNCSHKQIGYMTRLCSNTSVYLPPIYNCTKKELFNLYEELKGGSPTVAVEAFKRLPSLTSTQDGNQLQEGDIITSTAVLSTIAVISASVNISVEESESITDNFMEVVNNLIDKNNTVAMKSLVENEVGGADRVLAAIDSFAEVMSSRLNTTSKQIIKSNMVLELGLMDDCRYIQFPKKSPELNDTSKNGVKMRCSGDAKNRYAGVYYKNVSEMMPTRMTEQGESKVSAINAAVLSFSVYGDDVKKKLETPIEIVFQLFNEYLSVSICSFWNFSTGNDTGAWSESGCWVKGRFPDHVVCACNHLTNFALLMSVSKVKIADKHAAALSVISATGCGLSMMGLFLTVLLYTIYWRTVQSDRSVILLHLCCTLLLVYIVFLTGIQSTESWALCTTVAVVLHYLLLVVFFLMLVKGLNLAKSILFPLKALNSAFWKRVLILAWVLPALIVFISMAATQLEGYGNTSSCWLSVEGGLIWAFISPVLVIAMINIGIAVAVLKKMFQTVAVKNQTEKTKAWTAIRSICVLMPIMGITWILGVFAVNEHLVGFQYIFAILNSLQGLLIFVFHCAINKKIQKGILLSLRKYRRLPMIKFSSSNKTDKQGTAMTSSKT